MDDTAIRLRPLRDDDLPAAEALTASFGWPHRLEDWAFMRALGEGIAAERDGVLVGTGMMWPYGSDHAALGLFATRSSPTLAGTPCATRTWYSC